MHRYSNILCDRRRPVHMALVYCLIALSLVGLGSGSACQTQVCCSQDQDCATEFSCLGGVCRPHCLADQNCPLGQTCDPRARVCVGGPYPNECPWQFVDSAMDPQSDAGHVDHVQATDAGPEDLVNMDQAFFDSETYDHSAIDAGPAPDSANMDAGPGDVSSVDHIVPVCVDDPLEENDNLGQTATLASTEVGYGDDAMLCTGDDDFFQFSVVGEQNLRVDLRFEQSAGDIDLALFNQEGNQVGLSQGVDLVESIELQAPRNEVYTARVYGYNQAQGPYNLDVCFDDSREENDRLGRAVDIESGTHDLVLCRGDDDYFRLPHSSSSTPSSTVTLRLRYFAPSFEPPQLDLVARGNQVIATGVSASSEPNLILLEATVQNDRELFIAVRSSQIVSRAYQLEIDLGE